MILGFCSVKIWLPNTGMHLMLMLEAHEVFG